MNIDFGAIVLQQDWACKEVGWDLMNIDVLHRLGGLDGGEGLNEHRRWIWMALHRYVQTCIRGDEYLIERSTFLTTFWSIYTGLQRIPHSQRRIPISSIMSRRCSANRLRQ